MDDFKAKLAKAKDDAREAMEAALACATAFEDLVLAASRFLDNASGTATDSISPYTPTPTTYDLGSPPDLRHTVILEAKVDGKLIEEKTWNGVLRAVTNKAAIVVTSLEERGRLFKFRWEKGNLAGSKGFKCLPNVDISIQEKDTKVCCAAIYHIAYYLELAIEVVFRWPQKNGIVSAGMTGRLVFDGKPFTPPLLDLESI
jgi:hypothetical protein